jgi:hypothetical protein
MAKIKQVKHLVGQPVPPKTHGAAGREVEEIMAAQGWPMDRRGQGIDVPAYGFEVKSRDLDSTSSQSIGKMLPEDIKVTPFPDSPIHDKIQQQLRVKTQDQIIVSADMYDFSNPYIQQKIEESYESARAKIIAGDDSNYIPGGQFGYFERTNPKTSRSYDFRLTDRAMHKLESMATSTFKDLFE